jgi:hypothetical protein
MFKFQNATTACTEDDTVLMDLARAHSSNVESTLASTDTCYIADNFGQSYRGPLATTESGHACLPWGQNDQPGGNNIFSDPLIRDRCDHTSYARCIPTVFCRDKIVHVAFISQSTHRSSCRL